MPAEYPVTDKGCLSSSGLNARAGLGEPFCYRTKVTHVEDAVVDRPAFELLQGG